ncbi:hypothetical protein ACA910_006667 [Epithemia clementina (nom. ined.)]
MAPPQPPSPENNEENPKASIYAPPEEDEEEAGDGGTMEINFRLNGHGRTAPPPWNQSEASTTTTTTATTSHHQSTVLADTDDDDGRCCHGGRMDYTTQTRQASLIPRPPLCSTKLTDDNPSHAPQTTTTTTTTATTTSTVDGWLKELLLDCEIADSAIMPRTFWVPAFGGFTPRCSLEQMALDIFHFHTQRHYYVPPTSTWPPSQQSCCGAEWWVQIRPSPKGGRYSVLKQQHEQRQSNQQTTDGSLPQQECAEEEEEDLSEHGISFHWDKDEDLRLLLGGSTYIHPHISTVTYLTGPPHLVPEHGAPTLAVSNCRIHPLTGEWIPPTATGSSDHKTGTNHGLEQPRPKDPLNIHATSTSTTIIATDDEQAQSPPPQVFLSWPRILKHLSFDGRFLHAAPPCLAATAQPPLVATSQTPHGAATAAQDKLPNANSHADKDKDKKNDERQGRRVTFLVNIWLYYRPLNVEPFPECMLDKLSGARQPSIAQLSPPSSSSSSSSSLPSFTTPRLGLSISEQQDPVYSVTLNTSTTATTTTDENAERPSENASTLFAWPMGDHESGERIEMVLPTKEQLDYLVSSGQNNVCVSWTNSTSGLRLHRPENPTAQLEPEPEQQPQQQPGEEPMTKRPRTDSTTTATNS